MKQLPAPNLAFWVMLITATTLGETAGDLLSMTMHLGYATSSIMLVALFIVALVLQLYTKIEHDALYWTVIVLTSTAGTTMSDYLDRTLELGYTKGTLLLLALLTGIFVMWRLTARSLAITNIRTVGTELLFWSAILFSSTLGTALGDFLADDSGLGFGGGTLVLALLLVVIGLATLCTQLSRVLLFWCGIVVTHPIGATMGDYLAKPDGCNLGAINASLILLALFGAVALITQRTTRNIESL